MKMYGYNACFRPPKKRTRRQLLLTIALCVVLPPAGLVLLFGKCRCSLKGKAILSGIAVVCMTIILVLGLQILHPVEQVGYVPIETAITPTFVGEEDVQTSSTPVPANPLS